MQQVLTLLLVWCAPLARRDRSIDSLKSVCFVDRQYGWAVGGWPRDSTVSLLGGMGVILATDDGGTTWKKQLDGVATWLSDLCFRDAKRGFAVGEFGTILRTEDAGETWTNCPGPISRRANGWPAAYRAVEFYDARNGWIVGDGGSILRTTDGGRSWKLDSINLPPETIEMASFEDLSVAADGTAWAVSPLALLRYQPGQTDWQLVQTGQPGILRGASLVDSTTGGLVGDRSMVQRTSDGGNAWKQQLHSARKMKWLYATAHDHHINSSAIGVLSESDDTAYVCLHRGVRPFELLGDYNRKMVAASAMVAGVPVVHSFVEFDWRLRNEPHLIAQRYQNFHGLDGVERRLVAMIRTLRPEILVAEQPVTQEDYYAHGVGEIARAQILAFESAADPDKFPELLKLGLQPHAPKQLCIVSSWATEMYNIHPATFHVPGRRTNFLDGWG